MMEGILMHQIFPALDPRDLWEEDHLHSVTVVGQGALAVFDSASAPGWLAWLRNHGPFHTAAAVQALPESRAATALSMAWAMCSRLGITAESAAHSTLAGA